jgi:hypothetical protein
MMSNLSMGLAATITKGDVLTLYGTNNYGPNSGPTGVLIDLNASSSGAAVLSSGVTSLRQRWLVAAM